MAINNLEIFLKLTIITYDTPYLTKKLKCSFLQKEIFKNSNQHNDVFREAYN